MKSLETELNLITLSVNLMSPKPLGIQVLTMTTVKARQSKV